MRIPTDDIDRSSGTLWELSRNLERLSNRARDLAGQIASCYDGGGAGRRPANAADKAYRDARQAKNRAEILHRAVNIYTGREDELLNQAHAAAGTIKAGVNPQWTGKSWISDILLRQFTAVLPNHPGTTCQGMGRVFTFAALSSVLGAAAVVPYSILRRRGEKFGDIIKTAEDLSKMRTHTGTPAPSGTKPLSSCVGSLGDIRDSEAEDLAEDMKRDEYRSTIDVPLNGQHTGYTCGSASGSMILEARGVRVSEEVFYNNANANGQGTYVYRIAGELNNNLEGRPYSYTNTINMSDEQYYNTLKTSLDSGYPVEVVMRFPNNKYTGYSSGGHYSVVTGVYMNEEGTIMAQVNDPYSRQGPNHPQQYDIPLTTLRQYNNNHSGYIIYHKG